jgi:hypothetical protein
VDEPNPATAPITSDKKATMKNNISSNMIQDFSKIRIANLSQPTDKRSSENMKSLFIKPLRNNGS